MTTALTPPTEYILGIKEFGKQQYIHYLYGHSRIIKYAEHSADAKRYSIGKEDEREINCCREDTGWKEIEKIIIPERDKNFEQRVAELIGRSEVDQLGGGLTGFTFTDEKENQMTIGWANGSIGYGVDDKDGITIDSEDTEDITLTPEQEAEWITKQLAKYPGMK